MDFLQIRALEVGKMALDGLSLRHKLISANVANAETPDYHRSDVSFEGQIRDIIAKEDVKDSIKSANSERVMGLTYNPTSLGAGMDSDLGLDELQKEHYNEFKPSTFTDNENGDGLQGNNVNIEQEMAELSKNATKYDLISDMQRRIYRNVQDVIKGS